MCIGTSRDRTGTEAITTDVDMREIRSRGHCREASEVGSGVVG